MNLDVSEMILLFLTGLTAVVWTHSWIAQRREDRQLDQRYLPEEMVLPADRTEEFAGSFK